MRIERSEKFVRYIADKSVNRRVKRLNTVVKRLNGDAKHANREVRSLNRQFVGYIAAISLLIDGSNVTIQ